VNLNSLYTREKYLLIVKIVIAAAIIYMLIHALAIGGGAFIINLSDTVSAFLSVITGSTVFWLWRRFLPLYKSRPLWEWFLVGWGAWAVSEIWYVVESRVKVDIPLSGVSDILTIIGYLGLITGMALRVHEANQKMTGHQKAILGVLLLILIGHTLTFAILPVMQTHANNPWNAALDISYPIFDLILILLGIRLLIDYNTRRSRIGWRLIIIGFILMYVADLTYAYATNYGILYPDDQVNLISTFGYALPYDFAYVFWILGLYGLQVKLTSRLKEDTFAQPALVENTHILFYLNAEMIVDEVSTNYGRVFHESTTTGQPLSSLIPLTAVEVGRIKTDLIKRGKLTDFPLEVTNRKGQNRLAKLCGVHILDSQKAVTGALLVLRVLSDVNNLDLELNEYQQSLVDTVRVKSNSRESETVVDFMHIFYKPYIKRSYEVMLENGGLQQGVNYEEILNRQAQKNRWKLKVDSGSLEIPPDCTPAQVIKEMPALLMAAREQLEKIIDPEEVDAEVRLIRQGFSSEVMNNLYYIEHNWVRREN
jgi:hypothetical protein